ncbi:MAG TPA: serine/threonine-protein kinase [Kofleriaceae bacterium]|nr:serine/threonine-protein kinase [Kofleriaceae bacterium]
MAKIEAIARAMTAASRPASLAAEAASAGEHSTDEVRAFVQRRVASFSLLVSAVFSLFLVWRLVAIAVSPGERDGSTSYIPFQAAGVLVSAALWLLLRSGARSLRFVRAAEATGLTLGSACLTLMALYIPFSARPDIIIVQALTVLLVGRSIYVPSSARQTLVIGGLLALLAVPGAWLIAWRGFDPTMFAPGSEPARADPAVVAANFALVAALWWIAAVVMATAASRVIYGLREQVRDARRLGQYTLHEKLGSGGMGEVYRASHAMLRRPAAIKLLRPDRLGEESIARFEREVQLTALLTHPNTVRVFDYGRTPDRVFYYAMELLDGASLDQVVKATGAMPPGRVIHILEQCAGALAEAHEVGLIHRDVKPANILLVEQGGLPDVAKVVDFGLVKAVAGDQASAEEATLLRVTGVGTITGTPQYMAPEAISSPETTDARADLYALGAVGYFLLTGTEVFTGRTVLEVCSHHLRTEPVPPSGRLGKPLPADLERLILSCLAKAPADRPASARALRDALLACAGPRWSEEDARAWWREHGEALRARRAGAAGGAAAAASTIAVDLARRAG